MSYQDIAEDMDFLDNWEDRLAYVIDLGKAMPPLDDAQKSDLTRVRGCASQVWLVPEIHDQRLRFTGESDAMIVSGLIAVLLEMVNDHQPAEILEMDIRGNFDQLGLAAHLSGQRSNGLASMVERIEIIANEANKELNG